MLRGLLIESLNLTLQLDQQRTTKHGKLTSLVSQLDMLIVDGHVEIEE